ncbi:hypothetical protein ACTA71_011764 [Dictyostelium dimigraforme]
MEKQKFIFSQKKDGQIFKILDKSKSYDCKEVILQDYKNVENNNFKEYLILSGKDFEKTYRAVEFFSNEEDIKEQIKFIEQNSKFNSLWYKNLKVEKISIDECSKEKGNIFLTPMDQFNFKSTMESYEFQQDLLLKAMFHMIMGAYDIAENGPKNDSMFLSYLNHSFENLYLLSSYSPSSTSNIDFKLTYPFLNIHQDSNKIEQPFFKSIINYMDFENSDTLLNDIILKLNNQNISRTHFLFVVKKIIRIILKEKDRLLDKFPNSNLDEYFEQFETSILFDEQICIKMNIPNKIDPFKTVNFSSYFKSSKSDTGLLYLVNIKGKEYGVEIYRDNQINRNDIEIASKKSKTILDNNHLKFFDISKDMNKGLVYMVYELPTTFNYNKCNGFSNNDLSKDEKDQLFYSLIQMHISNYESIQVNVIKATRDLNTLKNYSLNLIISNEKQLFYSYSFNTKPNNNFIGSIYDIGKWVYGKNSEEVDQLKCLLLLQQLVWYNNIHLIHHQVRFLFSNIYNIIRKNVTGFKNIIPKIQINENKYATIKIELNDYYICNLSSPFESRKEYYKTITLTLKDYEGNKFTCFRKQNDSQLLGGDISPNHTSSPGEYIESVFIKVPIFTVIDSNTSFTLFEKRGIIHLKHFLLEYDHKVFLRLLLSYLGQLSNNNEMVLINLSALFDFKCETHFLFDIREFADVYFNILYGWDEKVLNSDALISQYILFNNS